MGKMLGIVLFVFGFTVLALKYGFLGISATIPSWAFFIGWVLIVGGLLNIIIPSKHDSPRY